MTKQHFEAIAKAIADAGLFDKSDMSPLGMRQHVAGLIAHTLGTFNPRFDTERFLAACDLD